MSFLTFVKKNWVWIALVIIICFGFYLRAYHMDYPVVGYHNWKETHYLTESRNFAEDGFFEHGFFVPEHDYPILGQDPSGMHADTFPTVSIIVGLAFKIFGPSLFIARLIMILFSMGSVLMMFLLMKKLFDNDLLALTTAFMATINPLFVFFSHNVQLMNPGVFFMLASAFFYVSWVKNNKTHNFVLTSLFFALAFLTKYPFGIIIIPMLFIFPYGRLKNFKSYIKEIVAASVFSLSIIFWFVYSNYFIASESGAGKLTTSMINLTLVFSSEWWTIMRSFAADNYTLIGVLFALLGFLSLFVLKSKKEGKRFVLGYCIGLVIFVFIMASKMNGHSYHQFPIAPLFVILISYFFVTASYFVSSFFKSFNNKLLSNTLRYFVVGMLILLVFFPSIEAKNRQFDTQFIGLDVAGEFIKENSEPGQTIVNSGHQDYGVLWHANMKGIKGVINHPVENLIRAEDEFNVHWLFLYQWGLGVMQEPEKWEYIQDSYSIRQIAFITTSEGSQPIYFVLEKGGSFNISKINDLVQDNQIYSREYEFTYGKQVISYVNI